MNTSAARQWSFEENTAPDAPVLRLVPGRNRVDDKVYEDTVLPHLAFLRARALGMTRHK